MKSIRVLWSEGEKVLTWLLVFSQWDLVRPGRVGVLLKSTRDFLMVLARLDRAVEVRRSFSGFPFFKSVSRTCRSRYTLVPAAIVWVLLPRATGALSFFFALSFGVSWSNGTLSEQAFSGSALRFLEGSVFELRLPNVIGGIPIVAET